MGVNYNPTIPVDHLAFCLDFGNPKINKGDAVNLIGFTSSGVTIDTTPVTGSVTQDGTGQVKFDDDKFGTYTWSNGFSVIVICSIFNLSSLSSGNYRGMLGTGNSFSGSSARFVNFWFQKSGTDLRLHQSTSKSDGSGFMGTFSNTFTPPADNQPIMVGYSHNASNGLNYYVHGKYLSYHYMGSPMINSWPSANELYVCQTRNGGGNYFTDGKINMVLIFNKLLSHDEHFTVYNTFKSRFGL